MWAGENGGQPDAIIEARGLKQISDTGAIGADRRGAGGQRGHRREYRAGKQKAFNSLVGQIMKAARGKANPQQVNDLLKQKAGRLTGSALYQTNSGPRHIAAAIARMDGSIFAWRPGHDDALSVRPAGAGCRAP